MKFKYHADYTKNWEESKKMGEQLQKDFPKIKFSSDFKRYGCECKAGWFEHIWSTLQLLYDENPEIFVSQIKEKFGGLRIYFSNGTDKQHEIMRISESKSFKICDICGKSGKTYNEHWIVTRCEDHKHTGRY